MTTVWQRVSELDQAASGTALYNCDTWHWHIAARTSLRFTGPQADGDVTSDGARDRG